MAETDPKYARAWLASLPLADSAETAREIYQSLYTLNRQELDVGQRFELMELYNAPVASVTAVLESYFTRAALPLTPKKRQLAEFIRAPNPLSLSAQNVPSSAFCRLEIPCTGWLDHLGFDPRLNHDTSLLVAGGPSRKVSAGRRA